MIIIDYGNEVHLFDGVYINYGLVKMRIPDEYIVPLSVDARDMYNF